MVLVETLKLPAQFFDRQHALAGRLGRHVGRVGKVFDEQPQIVSRLVARDLEVRKRLRAIVGDPEAEILVGVDPLAIQFGNQPLGPLHLLELLLARREANLLITQLLDDRAKIIGMHHRPSSNANLRGVPCDSSPPQRFNSFHTSLSWPAHHKNANERGNQPLNRGNHCT